MQVVHFSETLLILEYFHLRFLVLYNRMKSEELFEIDRKIKEIKRSMEQRHERATEWRVPVHRILQEKKNKDYYLLKKYPNVVDCYSKELSLCEAERKSKLKDKVEESRIKISKYKNSLKEMQELLKTRNIIRVIKMSEPNQQGRSTHHKSKDSKNSKTESSLNFQETGPLVQSSNVANCDRNAFTELKGQKLLAMYQQNRMKGSSGEEATDNIKRELGIGIQNTPFYAWIDKKSEGRKSAKPKFKNFKTKQYQKSNSDALHYGSHKSKQKPKICFARYNSESQKFEERLKSIIRFRQASRQTLTL